MKSNTPILVLLLLAGLILALVAQQPDPTYLTDSTGSLFKPTNGLARSLKAVDSADIRGGSQLLTTLETTKVIAFNIPMKDSTYIVLATPSLATSVSISGKTTNGFTLNLAVGIAGRVDWLAINP